MARAVVFLVAARALVLADDVARRTRRGRQHAGDPGLLVIAHAEAGRRRAWATRFRGERRIAASASRNSPRPSRTPRRRTGPCRRADRSRRATRGGSTADCPPRALAPRRSRRRRKAPRRRPPRLPRGAQRAKGPDGRHRPEILSARGRAATEAARRRVHRSQSAARTCMYSSGCSVNRSENPLGISRVRLDGTRNCPHDRAAQFDGLFTRKHESGRYAGAGLGKPCGADEDARGGDIVSKTGAVRPFPVELDGEASPLAGKPSFFRHCAPTDCSKNTPATPRAEPTGAKCPPIGPAGNLACRRSLEEAINLSVRDGVLERAKSPALPKLGGEAREQRQSRSHRARAEAHTGDSQALELADGRSAQGRPGH